MKRVLTLTALLALVTLFPLARGGAEEKAVEAQPVGPYKDFKGTIELDVRDSKADWGPFTPKKAPDGAPNILFVLYDDTGLAATFRGGTIQGVGITVEEASYEALELEAQRALSRD
jgi:hypothetical protein